MIQEFESEHVFDNSFAPHEPSADDYVLHYTEAGCLARVSHVGRADADAGDSGEVVELPRLADYPRPPRHVTYLFSLGEERFFLALDDRVAAPAGFAYESVNWLRRAEPQHLLFAAATGSQLDRWYRDNRFCGRCGAPTELAPASREIVCPECAHIVYPKICPGIICAVTSCDGDDEKIVLTRYAGRTTALWALVAGFTEIGEPLEDTVRREVMEEVQEPAVELHGHPARGLLVRGGRGPDDCRGPLRAQGGALVLARRDSPGANRRPRKPHRRDDRALPPDGPPRLGVAASHPRTEIP